MSQGIFALNVGETDPSGYTIKTVVLRKSNLLIYTTNENEIVYRSEDYNYPNCFNSIHSKIRKLETLVIDTLDSKKQDKFNYILANLLGEAAEITELVDSLPEKQNEIQKEEENRIRFELEQTESDIYDTIKSIQKHHFSIGTYVGLGIIILILLLLKTYSHWVISHSSLNTFEIIFSSFFGGIGASIFLFNKYNNFKIQRSTDNRYIAFGGVLRVVIGVFYALAIILGVKSNILFGFINHMNSINALCFIGLISGASDKIIANAIRIFEEKDKMAKNI